MKGIKAQTTGCNVISYRDSAKHTEPEMQIADEIFRGARRDRLQPS